MLESLATDERSPCLEDDAVRLAEGDELVAGHERVEILRAVRQCSVPRYPHTEAEQTHDLVHRGHVLAPSGVAGVEDLLQVLDTKVPARLG